MEKFRKMNMMIKPDGSEMSIAEYSRLYYDGRAIRVYKNDKYMVIKKEIAGADGKMELCWLSIKRQDRESIHDWRELQQIKNELVGPEHEAVELYPAESRCVDAANQYHLWVVLDKAYRFPFGFKERMVSGPKEAEEIGAKQRAFDATDDPMCGCGHPLSNHNNADNCNGMSCICRVFEEKENPDEGQ